jgi:hypothetical protein
MIPTNWTWVSEGSRHVTKTTMLACWRLKRGAFDEELSPMFSYLEGHIQMRVNNDFYLESNV